MIPHHVYYQLAILGLLWFCIMLHYLWPSRGAVAPPPPAKPVPPTCKRKRSKEPQPFAGLTQRPHCAACAHAANHPTPPPPRRPDPMPPTNRRPRVIDTSRHFCPHVGCDYQGWPGLGNLRANGHPSGGPWRQFHCTSCGGYVLETHGTIFHGKRASVDLIVRVIACLAEGLGIRGTARVFEVDPNTVLQWLVEAAEQLQAFSRHVLHDVRVRQVQLDELFALLSAVQAGEVSEAEAIARLERSPQWVWVAMDPESKLLLTIDVGERTLAMAQRVVHHVAQLLAPDCAPLFVTDGFREYLTALLTHYGQWVYPPRRQATGPAPKPRWMPRPQLLYAQVVKTVRRRRLVGVTHRVVFGTVVAVEQVLAPLGWQIQTAFVERLNLDIRQHIAAVGRRVNTLCKGADGLRQQLALYHTYYNFCLPHSSLRQPLPVPEATNGRGSAKVWRPCTPAMAAGLTDHVWTLKEVLMFRVPPWPQPQTV
jgi:transposase-like protein/IS1 family transposase